jgi:hypothetical protein
VAYTVKEVHIVSDKEEKQNLAHAQIRKILADIEVKVKEAQGIADEAGISFVFEPEHLGEYYGKNDENEGYWYPSDWNSSSVYC